MTDHGPGECGQHLWFYGSSDALARYRNLRASRVHEDVRRKPGRDPHAPRAIQTERGVGYVFAVAVERV